MQKINFTLLSLYLLSFKGEFYSNFSPIHAFLLLWKLLLYFMKILISFFETVLKISYICFYSQTLKNLESCCFLVKIL